MIEVSEKLISAILPPRVQNSSKGDFGKVLNISGSKQYVGAGMLSALAALKVGAGYSILVSDEESVSHYKSISCDLVYKSHGDFNFAIVRDILEKDKISSVVFGCGIGFNPQTIDFTKQLIYYLKETNIPVVIDADGLNCLSVIGEPLNENFVITPHPKELATLMMANVDEIQADREKFVKFAQEKFKCIVALKGYNTLIADKNYIFKNKTGSSALSKAGTGDVLAGMIGGFLAQKVAVNKATILSVYLHGAASELYTNEFSEYSLLASDLLNYIPLAIKEISSNQ